MLQAVNPQQYGIEEKKATELTGNLTQIKSEREPLIVQYDEVIKMDIDDPNTSKVASELRKRIKDNRTKGIEVWHKNTKDYFLKGGQFVDAIRRLEVEINTRMEDNLELIEKHQELKEQKRRDDLKAFRLVDLSEYMEFVPSGIDLGTMSVEEYQKIFNGAKLQFDAKVAEDLRIAEDNRIKEEQQKLYFIRSREVSIYKDYAANIVDINSAEWGKMTEEEYSEILDKLKISKMSYDFEKERRIQIAPYVQFLSHSPSLRGMSDKEYQELIESLKEAKKQHDDEQEAIRLENLRLKEEAEAKEAEGKRRGELLKPLLAYVTDYPALLLLSVEDFEKKLAELTKEKKDADDFEASENLRKQKEKEARTQDAIKFLKAEGFIEDNAGFGHNAIHHFIGSYHYSDFDSDLELQAFKSETSLQVKKALDEKADNDRKAKEAQDAIDAENLAKAPIKQQLKVWVSQFSLPETSIDNEVSKEIMEKFESFRTWSVKVVDNL